MPLVSGISVQNVRPHEAYRLAILPSTTVITGVNGSGKTSLIEALYIALQGTSFKGGDSDVLRRDAPWYRIDIAFADNTTRTVKFDPSRSSGKKQFVVNEKTQYRLSQKDKYPVVLFEPDDLRLLHGSPARRREYIDRFISQIEPLFAQALRKYDRALKQRNNLLKRPEITSDELFVWDMVLSEYGSYIIARRAHYCGLINAQLSGVYHKIADTNDSVALYYAHADLSQQKMLAELHAAQKKDSYLGFTSVGPHRHDCIFLFNQSPALLVASRGEVRSVIIALKFIEVALLEQYLAEKPVILLDDVFSELDASRQSLLVENFKDHQVIITSATLEDKDAHVIREIR